MSVPLAEHEPRHDPKDLTANPDPSQNSSTGVDYEPHPERSISIPPEREEIITKINNLYSGKPSEDDMRVYAAEAVYDDPFTFCDTRYKIAGQWYGTYIHSALLAPMVLITIFFQGFQCSLPRPRSSRRRSFAPSPRSSASRSSTNLRLSWYIFPNQSTAS